MSTPVTLRGRLTRDPELRFSANGNKVTKFSVVTSRRIKNDRSGEWEDRDTTFWDCVAFGQLAENVAESLEKGFAVIVAGSASQDEWEDKNGQKRRSMKVIADDVAPSLRSASAKIMRAERRGAAEHAGGEDPWASGAGGYSAEPPFL